VSQFRDTLPAAYRIPIPAGHALHIKRSSDNLSAQVEVMRFLTPAEARHCRPVPLFEAAK
jgi:hypothetical protein